MDDTIHYPDFAPHVIDIGMEDGRSTQQANLLASGAFGVTYARRTGHQESRCEVLEKILCGGIDLVSRIGFFRADRNNVMVIT